MKQAYIFQDDKTHKFWVIDYDDIDACFSVNFGKIGTTGKYQIKEFDNNDECQKQAKKLINSKIKKGYVLTQDFDFTNHLYFDDEEYGLHPKTSHPIFNQYFCDEIYFDCIDEEAPFGSDAGSDAFLDLAEYIKKHGDKEIMDFAHQVMISWGYEYYIPPTQENMTETQLKSLLNSHLDYITELDQVIIATAFGQIKIMGKINPKLKALALLSMERRKKSFEILGCDVSEIGEKLYDDLNNFKVDCD